jgi:cardiolipin synthase
VQPIHLYMNQTTDDLREVMTTAIREAKKSIVMIIYGLSDERIIRALKEKSEEGIDVRVIYDSSASPNIPERLGPKVTLLRRFSKGIMHQKILIVDGEQTWIGSANMTKASLCVHGNLIAALYSPELAGILLKKADGLSEEGRGAAIPHQELHIGGQQVELWLLPDDYLGAKRLVDLMRGAQKTLRVAMFTWTREDFAEAVIAAKGRGVDVQVVLDGQTAKGASKKIVNLLQANDIFVKVSEGNALLHHKFLYIDSRILVNGSANWTHAAFTKNDDCFIILEPLTAGQQEQLDSLWRVILMESASP